MTKTEAIEKAHGQAALAEILGVSRQAVFKWPGDRIPPLQLYRLKELKPRWFRKSK